MKILLLNIFIFLGLSKAYADTSKIIDTYAKEASEQTGGENEFGDLGGCGRCF